MSVTLDTRVQPLQPQGADMVELVHLVAEADQLAAQARDARCCDALDPCPACMQLRQAVLARRFVTRIPRQRSIA